MKCAKPSAFGSVANFGPASLRRPVASTAATGSYYSAVPIDCQSSPWLDTNHHRQAATSAFGRASRRRAFEAKTEQVDLAASTLSYPTTSSCPRLEVVKEPEATRAWDSAHQAEA